MLLSLVGALVAVAVRHWTSQNWTFALQDIWYFMLSAGISIMLALLGYSTGFILAASSGINTPLALVKTGMDKYSERKDNAEIDKNKVNIQVLKDRLAQLEAAKSG